MPTTQFITLRKCKVCGTEKPSSEFLALHKTCLACKKPKPRLSPTERLFRRRRITEHGCWEWTGATDDKMGYGKMTYVFPNDPREYKVHRLAAHLFLGFDLASEMQVCHRCDNPPCFNPAHLFIGTAFDNMQDASTKGRMKLFRNRGLKLTRAEAVQIRESALAGERRAEIAARYGVSETLVRRIERGMVWKYAV